MQKNNFSIERMQQKICQNLYEVMKPKILFIMHMPPPVHGAAMIGKYIHDSKNYQMKTF